MHMLEDILGDLYKDDIVLEVLLLQLFSSDSQDNKALVNRWITLSLVFVDGGGLGGEGDLVRASGERIDDLVKVILAEEAVQCIP